jgi:hypothetical protein
MMVGYVVLPSCLQDKRNGSGSSAGGSSGFLSSLGKAVMGDLRISLRSPGGMQQGSSGGAARVTHLHLLLHLLALHACM